MFDCAFFTIACKTHFVNRPNCGSPSDFDLLMLNSKKSIEEHFKVVWTISSNEPRSIALAFFSGNKPFSKSSSSLRAAITSDAILPSDRIE